MRRVSLRWALAVFLPLFAVGHLEKLSHLLPLHGFLGLLALGTACDVSVDISLSPRLWLCQLCPERPWHVVTHALPRSECSPVLAPCAGTRPRRPGPWCVPGGAWGQEGVEAWAGPWPPSDARPVVSDWSRSTETVPISVFSFNFLSYLREHKLRRR